MTDAPSIDAKTLAAWLGDGEEIALLDLREEGLFGEGHAFFASNIPYSRLEAEIRRLVPRLQTRIVLAGEEATDSLGARRLFDLGYTDVHLLGGGVAAWAAVGNRLFTSIYVPSKAFAEVVEHHFHTPAIEAAELKHLLDSDADVVVLDSRTVEEFERFHVPGAVSCPSAELVHRFDDLVPSPDTFVVVSCAGRTRGIIGAQALINAGVPNRVAALSGGTQSWRLEAFEVEKGRTAVYGDLSPQAAHGATVRARAMAERFGVPVAALDALAQWRADPQRTTYVFDVRTPQEYRAGHLPGAISIPGGQLVQALDAWAAVRGARIVLVDDALTRAVVTAHWVRQLGWDAVAVAYDPQSAPLEAGTAATAPTIETVVPEIDADAAKTLLLDGAPALFADSSAAYRALHPAGAVWANRSRLGALPAHITSADDLLIFGSHLSRSHLLAIDLLESHPGQRISVVRGAADAWEKAGIPLESTPQSPPDAERVDFLFWLYDRHLGNADASRAYLAWEGSLPALIGSPEAAGYRLAPAHAPALEKTA